jgi:hypothetical protein
MALPFAYHWYLYDAFGLHVPIFAVSFLPTFTVPVIYGGVAVGKIFKQQYGGRYV